MNLVEKSSALSKVLHLIDCLSIVGFLWILGSALDVSWSDHYSFLACQSFILSYCTFYSFQLYRSWRGSKLYKEFIVIVKAWGATVGILLFLFFVFKTSTYYSRSVILTWFGLSPFVVFALHFLVRQILHHIRKKGWNTKTAVIVGADTLGIVTAEHIEHMAWAGIRVLGFFDNEERVGDTLRGKPILGKISSLAEYVKIHRVDSIYIALPVKFEETILSIIDATRTLGASLYRVADFFNYTQLNSEMQFLGDMVIFSFNPSPRAKRYFDIVFSLAALLITLPITLLIAVVIKLHDRGPVFYGHGRITAAGKEFKCLKFRTMHIDADKKLAEILAKDPAARKEWEKTFKLKKDPRVTQIGKFLRKTSLDELPQFINVLKGEMSVVGARPIVHAELRDYYKQNAGLYCSMKPGITGPWQIGKRNDTENYSERVSLDTWYVLNHSIWLDLKIIFKTCISMIKGSGAY